MMETTLLLARWFPNKMFDPILAAIQVSSFMITHFMVAAVVNDYPV